jgi:hypothetical protein
MSAWKKLSRNTWLKKICTPRSASTWKLTPAALSAAISSIGMPYTRSITSTFGRL